MLRSADQRASFQASRRLVMGRGRPGHRPPAVWNFLVNFHVHRLGCDLLVLRNVYLQHAVLVVGGDFLARYVLREQEVTLEDAISPLDAMIPLALLLLLKLPLTSDVQSAVLHRDFHVLLLHFGEFRLDEVFLFVLRNISERSPLFRSEYLLINITPQRAPQQRG